ncbi:MAG TPA: beta-eliminating lyase-related protein, partial [Casimicrobiaceae bacterium]|nr:beta-eliminating lyase-related protein [Casimicrobiaceae bacterium]
MKDLGAPDAKLAEVAQSRSGPKRRFGPPGDTSTPLVQVENTHNRAGGIVFPQDEAVLICAAARRLGIASYLDGARLWNVA